MSTKIIHYDSIVLLGRELITEMQVYIKKHRQKWTKVKILYFAATIASIFAIIFINNTSYTRETFTENIIVINKSLTRNISSENKQDETLLLQKRKYILLWTDHNNSPFIYLGNGNVVFVERKCKWNNCYVTDDRKYLGAYTEFDVVAFNGPQLMDVYNNDDLPKVRNAQQKYVYANIEAAVNYPICGTTWDRYFNWTWTYKLNSDAVWGYLLVKNTSGHVIAPSIHVDWINIAKMKPVDESLRIKLKQKNKAAAWFVSNCRTMGGREAFVNELRNYLNYYNLDVDIYGDCGRFICPKEMMDQCLSVLEDNYYFYLAFENAISVDYVTEKITHALNHYTVPVVFGGANYSRFMPPGAYLNARELGARNLALKIYESIHDPAKYLDFFRWRKHYSYHLRYESPDTDDYCRFCAMINDKHLMNSTTIYKKFTSWWTTEEGCSALVRRNMDYM